MSTPTPCLDLLLLAATVFPAGFSGSLASRFDPRSRVSADLRSLWILGGTLVSLIALGLALKPALAFLHPAAPGLLLVAVLAGPCLLYAEYLVGAVLVYASTGRWLRDVSLTGAWHAGVSASAALVSAIVGIGEEVIWRQFWFSLLGGFGLPALVVLVVSSLVYGANHAYFGPAAVAQKSLAGAFYGGLYLASGCSVIVPATAHAVENLTLLGLAARHRG